MIPCVIHRVGRNGYFGVKGYAGFDKGQLEGKGEDQKSGGGEAMIQGT